MSQLTGYRGDCYAVCDCQRCVGVAQAVQMDRRQVGGPDEVVPQDIEAIKKCKTIFAVLDGMDSGTVFEVGYGVALGKRIIILAENESKMHLQMMLGTHCCVEKDFVTAIYKTCWMTYE